MSTATKTFEYSVRDRKGKLVSGKLEAPSEAALVQRLRGMGYAPLTVRETGIGFDREINIPGTNRVKFKDLAVMSRQFATMINSGLSLLRALAILSEQTENKLLAKTLGEVRTAVETGQSLSSALAKHPKVFPPLVVNMVRAGEVGGFLDKVMLQIAENYEAEVKLRGKIKSAMTYPVVVFVIAILATIGMLLFIVPIFANMFTDLGGTLPLPTQILVNLSNALRLFAPLGVVLAIVGVVAWAKVRHQEQVRKVVDPLKLRCRSSGSSSRRSPSAGSPGISAPCSPRRPHPAEPGDRGRDGRQCRAARRRRRVQDSVRRGESLAGPLSHHKVFPPMVVQMLSVGEDTGAIDTMLQKVSDFYDAEVEATTEALTSLIEPLMIAVLGTLIGGMIIALYMPIFNVFDLIK